MKIIFIFVFFIRFHFVKYFIPKNLIEYLKGIYSLHFCTFTLKTEIETFLIKRIQRFEGLKVKKWFESKKTENKIKKLCIKMT